MQEGGVDKMDASAAVPVADLDLWLLEEALAAPTPVCLLILSVSDRAWLILHWKELQAAGQQVVQAIIRVRQSLPLSPGVTRMRAGEHMQQSWCQSLLPSGSLTHIVCATGARSGWTALGAQKGEAAACQR
jgi:uncharacterized membrane protein